MELKSAVRTDASVAVAGSDVIKREVCTRDKCQHWANQNYVVQYAQQPDPRAVEDLASRRGWKVSFLQLGHCDHKIGLLYFDEPIRYPEAARVCE